MCGDYSIREINIANTNILDSTCVEVTLTLTMDCSKTQFKDAYSNLLIYNLKEKVYIMRLVTASPSDWLSHIQQN